MILSVTFSKPSKNIQEILDRDYIKIRIFKAASSITKAPSSLNTDSIVYNAEFFTQKQAFQKTMTAREVEDFIKTHAGTTFKNVVQKTDTEEITIMANRHGELKELHKKLNQNSSSILQNGKNTQKNKNYILKEGIPVPFLVKLGVMTKDGKVIASKYDKYRQINRFLEYIQDIIPEVTKLATGTKGFTKERPLRIADFGCGKSYLTFAVYYYLNTLCNIPVEITGLDLKEDVIKHCQNLAKEYNYTGLNFYVGDVAEYKYKDEQDIMITLHACDTATDYALNYAVTHNAKAILSVPCCQHEINLQLEQNRKNISTTSSMQVLLQHGILRERFAALATDALRAELLEQKGYNVQLLEFIDMEGTPKNLLIRAVQKKLDNENARQGFDKAKKESKERCNLLLDELKVKQTLFSLLGNTASLKEDD